MATAKNPCRILVLDDEDADAVAAVKELLKFETDSNAKDLAPFDSLDIEAANSAFWAEEEIEKRLRTGLLWNFVFADVFMQPPALSKFTVTKALNWIGNVPFYAITPASEKGSFSNGGYHIAQFLAELRERNPESEPLSRLKLVLFSKYVSQDDRTKLSVFRNDKRSWLIWGDKKPAGDRYPYIHALRQCLDYHPEPESRLSSAAGDSSAQIKDLRIMIRNLPRGSAGLWLRGERHVGKVELARFFVSLRTEEEPCFVDCSDNNESELYELLVGRRDGSFGLLYQKQPLILTRLEEASVDSLRSIRRNLRERMNSGSGEPLIVLTSAPATRRSGTDQIWRELAEFFHALEVPSFGQRKEDIAELALLYTGRMQRSLTSEAFARIKDRDWPGGWFELYTAIAAAVGKTSALRLDLNDFVIQDSEPATARTPAPGPPGRPAEIITAIHRCLKAYDLVEGQEQTCKKDEAQTVAGSMGVEIQTLRRAVGRLNSQDVVDKLKQRDPHILEALWPNVASQSVEASLERVKNIYDLLSSRIGVRRWKPRPTRSSPSQQ